MKSYGLIRDEYVDEILTEMAKPDFRNMKSYCLDWDDNILYMPTSILLKDENGKIVEVSTSEYAEVRNKMDELGYSYFDKSFIGFREETDDQFISDSLNAPTGPSWEKFVKALNSGSLFAIITARGHSPESLKEAVKQMIYSEKEGINVEEILDSLKHYRGLFGMETQLSSEQIIDEYLDLCEYYPVSNEKIQQQLGVSGDASNPEELKNKARLLFSKKIHDLGGKVEEIIGGEIKISMGFSDDDKKNYYSAKEFTKNVLSKTYPNTKFVDIYTGKEELEEE